MLRTSAETKLVLVQKTFWNGQVCDLWSLLAVWMRWWRVRKTICSVPESGSPSSCPSSCAAAASCACNKMRGCCLEGSVRTNVESTELCAVRWHLNVDKRSFLILEAMTTLNWFCLSAALYSSGQSFLEINPWNTYPGSHICPLHMLSPDLQKQALNLCRESKAAPCDHGDFIVVWPLFQILSRVLLSRGHIFLTATFNLWAVSCMEILPKQNAEHCRNPALFQMLWFAWERVEEFEFLPGILFTAATTSC